MSKKLERGFTLIETLVASFVFLAALIGIFGLYLNSTRYTETAKRHTLATNYARERMEFIRTLDFASLPSNPINDGNLNTRNPIAGTNLTMNTYIEDLGNTRRVTVSVYRLEDPNGNPEITLTEILARASAQVAPCTITGTVTDDMTGALLVGATVSAAGKTVTTGSDGKYIISDIPYTSEPLAISAQMTHYLNFAGTVNLVSGAIVVYNIQLHPLCTITGTVRRSDDNSPLSGVTVSAGGKTTTTAADGSYTLMDLTYSSSPITITATKTGYQNYSGSVTLIDGRNVYHDIYMIAQATIMGNIINKVSGANIGVTGWVKAWNSSPNSWSSPDTQSLSNGTYTIPNVDIANLNKYVRAWGMKGYCNSIYFSVTVAPAQTATCNIYVDPATKHTITGWVYEKLSGGQIKGPIKGAKVWAYGFTQGAVGGNEGNIVFQPTPDDGSFTLNNIKSGDPNYNGTTYTRTVYASCSGYNNGSTSVSLMPIQLGGSETVSGVYIYLVKSTGGGDGGSTTPTSGTINVTIKNGSTGAVIDTVQVTLTLNPVDNTKKTNTGSYSYTNVSFNSSTNPYTVTASAPNFYSNTSGNIVVTSSSPTANVTIYLTPYQSGV